MGGGNWCVVQSCKNNSKMRMADGRNLSVFSFPKDEERHLLWLKQINREVLPNTHSRICEIHFESSMFLNNRRNRLQPHAIPVLHLVDTDLDMDINITSDHSVVMEEDLEPPRTRSRGGGEKVITYYSKSKSLVWSESNTKQLIALVKEQYQHMTSVKKKREAWLKILKEIQIQTKINVTLNQVKLKWQGLVSDAYRDVMKEKSKRFIYFDEIVDVLTQKHQMRVLETRKRRAEETDQDKDAKLPTSEVEEVIVSYARKRPSGVVHWSESDTKQLIALVKEQYQRINDRENKKQAWLQVAEDMQIRTKLNFTTMQVYNKWRCLVKTYEGAKKGGQFKRSRFIYFDEIRDALNDEEVTQTIIQEPKQIKIEEMEERDEDEEMEQYVVEIWSDSDTKQLITLVREEYQHMKNRKKKRLNWHTIFKEIQIRTKLNVTLKQVITKWRNLVQAHRDAMKGKIKTSIYVDEIDDIVSGMYISRMPMNGIFVLSKSDTKQLFVLIKEEYQHICNPKKQKKAWHKICRLFRLRTKLNVTFNQVRDQWYRFVNAYKDVKERRIKKCIYFDEIEDIVSGKYTSEEKKKLWSECNTKLLITLVKEQCQHVNNTQTRGIGWHTICKRFRMRTKLNVTLVQLKSKWQILAKAYRDVKREGKFKKCIYFDEVDEVMRGNYVSLIPMKKILVWSESDTKQLITLVKEQYQHINDPKKREGAWLTIFKEFQIHTKFNVTLKKVRTRWHRLVRAYKDAKTRKINKSIYFDEIKDIVTRKYPREDKILLWSESNKKQLITLVKEQYQHINNTKKGTINWDIIRKTFPLRTKLNHTTKQIKRKWYSFVKAYNNVKKGKIKKSIYFDVIHDILSGNYRGMESEIKYEEPTETQMNDVEVTQTIVEEPKHMKNEEIQLKDEDIEVTETIIEEPSEINIEKMERRDENVEMEENVVGIWSQRDIKQLITLVKEEYQHVNNTKKRTISWLTICEKIRIQSKLNVTIKQVSDKWDSLVKAYKVLKKGRIKTSIYFDEIHDIMSGNYSGLSMEAEKNYEEPKCISQIEMKQRQVKTETQINDVEVKEIVQRDENEEIATSMERNRLGTVDYD